MPLTRFRHPRVWHYVAGFLLAIVFAVDTLTPVGIAVPMLYVVPTVLFVGSGRFAEPLIVAAIATVLTAAG